MTASKLRPISSILFHWFTRSRLRFLQALELLQMLRKTTVCLLDQALAELVLAAAGLVARHQQNSFPVRIEREGDAPNTVRSPETKLLHIGIVGAVQRICMRAPELRT